MAMRGPRHPIGAAAWIEEERSTALQMMRSEVDEFSFSVKNELDWLNEHMAEIFSENPINVADIFKTPGKLRAKTPRTARKGAQGDFRAPLTDVFSAASQGSPNPFAVSKLTAQQQHQRRQSPAFVVAEDKPARASARAGRKSRSPPRRAAPGPAKALAKSAAATAKNAKKAAAAKQPTAVAPPSLVDSGYHGSQSQDTMADGGDGDDGDDDEDELAGDATLPFSQESTAGHTLAASKTGVQSAKTTMVATTTTTKTAAATTPASPHDELADRPSPTQPTVEPTFHSAKEEQTAVVASSAAPPMGPASPTGMASLAVAAEPLSSSPFCPVQTPSSAMHLQAKEPSPSPPPPPQQQSRASPRRKPVPPPPSSPLQSTTPACPPPRELLSAVLGHSTAAVASPSLPFMDVPPAVPTPPMASIPAFIAEKKAAVAASLAQKEDEEDTEEEELHKEQRQLRIEDEDAAHSPSDPSSPVRPMVRKSSINFASLPAREPFTSNKSMGGPAASVGLARAGHIDPARTSYYHRPAGGKSLGNAAARTAESDQDDDQEDGPALGAPHPATQTERDDMAAHNKTYAQRLHDRISMLGKSQANGPRPSKSLASHLPGAAQGTLAALAHQQESQYAVAQKPQQLQKKQQQPPQQQEQLQKAELSPKRSADAVAAPGAFPEDDDDDWIAPPPSAAAAVQSPRQNMAKSSAFAAIAREEAGSSNSEFVLPKQRQNEASRAASPKRPQTSALPERTTAATTTMTTTTTTAGTLVAGRLKSASVPSLPMADPAMLAVTKPISVSNPANASGMALDPLSSPPKSPSRSYRDSPLRHVKNKLSSILKSSKGLLASSAAISAEGKSSLLSPSATRLGLLMAPSLESLALKPRNDSTTDLARPDLTRQASAMTVASSSSAGSGTHDGPASPTRSESPSRPNRKTRASLERERRELKQREKEMKEVQRMAQQMGKLEKEREKEREKARAFVEENKKTAAATSVQREQWDDTDDELGGGSKEDGNHDNGMDAEMATGPPPSRAKPLPPSSPVAAPIRSTRTSPRKAKTPYAADADVDMADAPPTSMLPPPPPAHGTVASGSSVPRPAAAQGTRTIRRPIKPTKEAPAKAKQAPTVIRVNTSSSHHHQQQQPSAPMSQFHPSNSVLAASLHETLVAPPHQHTLKSKASTASLHTKPSLQSLKSSVSSSGRPKALELAAKRKEQEEREAQRKRDAKAEMERKRAALQEQEEQRKQEQQRQRERERAEREREREREQAQAEAAAAKRAAAAAAQQQQRQAALEKAKQTRAPPPAPRTQLPSGVPSAGDYAQPQPARPQSRLATAAGSTMHRSQEELQRPVNAVLMHGGKSLSKRPLGGGADAGAAGGGTAGHKDAKRIRLSDEFDEDELEMGGHVPRVSSIKGPPVRPSGGFKKDLPSKSVFGNGYAPTAGASASVSRDLFKTTVTTQHNSQASRAGGHPLDMAHVSKAAISFATNGGSTTAAAAAAAAAAASASASAPSAPPPNPHKTPLRPVGAQLTGKSTAKSTAKSAGKSASKSVGKSGARSSPRFPNGDGIELPEIQTDDEDSEDDGGHVNAAPWADSPDLRRALMRQETVDPFQVFGPPAPLNMEEVFSKSKDRWHKFRARTSSANWSGSDRLTEEEIRKDMAARDKIRREGGWSYELGREV